MRFLIIGLGIYGSNLAIDLTNFGHEVIGADSNPALVDNIKDLISTAYILDATDENALSALPVSTVDLVIVAIGENFGASIRIVALLKQLGAKHIFARAIDKLHEAILESFEIDRILTPEQQAAFDLVNEMGVNTSISIMRLDDDNYIMNFTAPDLLVGQAYSTLDLEKDYGIRLIAVTRPLPQKNIMGIEHQRRRMLADISGEYVERSDMLVCLGTAKAYKALYSRTSTGI